MGRTYDVRAGGGARVSADDDAVLELHGHDRGLRCQNGVQDALSWYIHQG